MQAKKISRHILQKLRTAFAFACVIFFVFGAAREAAAQEKIESPKDIDTRTLNVVISNMPYSLHPHTGTYHTEAQIQSAIYEGLFTYGPTADEPKEALAAQTKVSRDRKRWTFTLRENALWSDGTKITASDVRESWLNLMATPNAAYSSMLDVIEGAKAYREGEGRREDVAIFAKDDSTLTVRLTEPTGHLPHILCHNSMAVVKNDNQGAFSGAFTMEEISDNTIVLAKNEKYWDAENVQLEKINIVHAESGEESSYLFNTGNADWIVENAEIGTVLNKNAVQVAAEFATLYIYFKNGGGATDNKLLRTALLEAVPWDTIRSGFIIPATTLVYPTPNYPAVSGFSYTDLEEAAELMRQARESLGLAQDEKITITFAIGENTEYMRKIAQALSEAWLPLGVELRPLTVRGDYFGSLTSINADMFMYNWIGDFGDPIAFLELFRGDSTLNVTAWQNSSFDALLSESAYAETAERLKLLAAAEQILLDDAEILPISHMVSLNVIDLKAVGGWNTNALNVHPFKFMFKRKAQGQKPDGVI